LDGVFSQEGRDSAVYSKYMIVQLHLDGFFPEEGSGDAPFAPFVIILLFSLKGIFNTASPT